MRSTKNGKRRAPRGPLHGIPVLIKDNIDTADRMATTAGSLALVGSNRRRMLSWLEQLREAGAVILGKTNLSEWANFRSSRSTSGWSGRGGLTKNPYALDRNSFRLELRLGRGRRGKPLRGRGGHRNRRLHREPVSVCGIVGIKPTVGLVSRTGIIPISHTQDTAGPMARTVRDAAILLGALTGADPRIRRLPRAGENPSPITPSSSIRRV